MQRLFPSGESFLLRHELQANGRTEGGSSRTPRLGCADVLVERSSLDCRGTAQQTKRPLVVKLVCYKMHFYRYRRVRLVTTMPRHTKSQLLLKLAKKGPVRALDLDTIGVPRVYLKRLCESGELERIDRGLYRLASADVTELSSLADVSKRVPHAAVCLLSALQLHGLTTEVPHAVWLLIDREARTPSIKSPKLEIVHASGTARTHGLERRVIDGVKVTLTTPAKTVADCFRYRRHVGMEVAISALKDYLRKRKGTVDVLVAAARADRVLVFMRPYLEALS